MKVIQNACKCKQKTPETSVFQPVSGVFMHADYSVSDLIGVIAAKVRHRHGLSHWRMPMVSLAAVPNDGAICLPTVCLPRSWPSNVGKMPALVGFRPFSVFCGRLSEHPMS